MNVSYETTVCLLQASVRGCVLRFRLDGNAMVVSTAAEPENWPEVVRLLEEAGFEAISVATEEHGVVAGSFVLGTGVVPEGFELQYFLRLLTFGFKRIAEAVR